MTSPLPVTSILLKYQDDQKYKTISSMKYYSTSYFVYLKKKIHNTVSVEDIQQYNRKILIKIKVIKYVV